MRNGRSPENSYGKSTVNSNLDFSLKAGGTYKISGRQYITANLAYMTRPPLLQNAYISPRTSADLASGLTDTKIASGDLSYVVRYPNFNARITAYETAFKGYNEIQRFYDDDLKTFVNMALTNENRIHQGLELGAEAKVMSYLSVVAVVSYGNYRYTNHVTGTRNYDNGSLPDTTETVYLKNFFVGGSPQVATNLGLRFNKNYWFVNLNGNYYDQIWLDFNPQLRTSRAVNSMPPGDPLISTLVQQQQLKGGFTLDGSVGKSIRVKDYYINITLNVNNILDNKKLISGGYEQTRISYTPDSPTGVNLAAFPPKYYYAYGRTYSFNVGFRF